MQRLRDWLPLIFRIAEKLSIICEMKSKFEYILIYSLEFYFTVKYFVKTTHGVLH